MTAILFALIPWSADVVEFSWVVPFLISPGVAHVSIVICQLIGGSLVQASFIYLGVNGASCQLYHGSPAGQKTSSHSSYVPKAARDGASPNEKAFVMSLLGLHLLMPCCQSKPRPESVWEKTKRGCGYREVWFTSAIMLTIHHIIEISNHVPVSWGTCVIFLQQFFIIKVCFF